MDDETFRDDYPPHISRDSSRCVPKPSARRQTQHVASNVDFRVDRDLARIPENENSRRKQRTKPRHCPSCLSQSIHADSMDLRPNDNRRRKNPEKLEASPTQHLDYGASNIASSLVRNRNIQRRNSRSSPRALTVNQRLRYRRPGTSRNRINPCDAMVHRFGRKRENIEPCECTKLDSPLRDIVISDIATEDTDFLDPRENIHSGNICKESDLYFHSPPGEPHSEPEIDISPQKHQREYPESKKRHSGQGESLYENCREAETKISIETGSSVDKEVRKQWKRDQRELKELYEDLDEFAKRKATGWTVADSHGENYEWNRSKQQRDEKNEEMDSQDLLESINEFVGKVTTQRKCNVSRVAAAACASIKDSKACGILPKEQSERSRSSKLDSRKIYRSVGTDGRTIADNSQQREVERNLDYELADIRLECSKRDEEETKEFEYLSETEEEARELARDDTETEQINRQLEKSWATCKRRSSGISNPRISGKEQRNTRDPVEDNEEKTYGKLDCDKKRINTRERNKGLREKEIMIREESLRRNYVGRNETERKDGNGTNNRERIREKEEMADKNCYSLSATREVGDLELETSKTKTCIDEIIDSGLKRETRRGNGGTLVRDTGKDLQREGEEGPSKRGGTSDETSQIICPDCISPDLRNDELPRGDCFCKTLAKIVADYRDPQEYVRKLKNCRWAYLNHMQSDLEKLYGLEKFLDSCSPERRSAESKDVPEKREKGKRSRS